MLPQQFELYSVFVGTSVARISRGFDDLGVPERLSSRESPARRIVEVANTFAPGAPPPSPVPPENPGIGRTSTMLMAGHLVRGETLPDLRRELATTNPDYQFRGKQTAFLKAFAEEFGLA